MSGQRARSAVPADHRSVHPDFPGVPWWGAVLIALTATAVGFAFDAGSGNKELSAVFSASYIVGCLLAVLAVRQAGVFTAVIQPPIVLFAAVPSAYFLFHGGQIHGLKDLAINCGYPLIERFPLMFFTSAAVLLIGLGRWYYGMGARRVAPASDEPQTPSAVNTLMASVTTKLTALVTGRRPAAAGGRGGETAAAATARPRKRSTAERSDRPARAGRRTTTRTRGSARAEAAARTAEGGRTPRRRPPAEAADQPRSSTRRRRSSKAAPPRSRPARPADTDYIEPVADRPRRRRPVHPDEPPAPPAQPRRRSRGQAPRDRSQPPPRGRRMPPREPRRQPPVERTGYEPFDPRPPRPRRAGGFDDFEPLEPHTRAGARSTHHPVSKVRYRSAEDGEERADYRNRPRHTRHARNWEADSWEYDI
ncbi:DUF6542 domain-containing protein [Mycolicibacterium thermoresistibile]